MTRHDPRVSLQHMLDYAREALSMIDERQRSDLENDRLLGLALSRVLEIVGEAANRVPQEEQQRYPQIEWRRIINMRNRLIHGYDLLDYEVIWGTVSSDMLPLIEALEEILRSED